MLTKETELKGLPHTTPMGTIIRNIWTNQYYQMVLAAERAVKHGICGAPTAKDIPCRMRPKEEFHYYCRFHKPDKTTLSECPEDTRPSKHPFNVDTNISARADASLSAYEKEKGIFKKLMPIDHLRKNFARCSECPVKEQCVQYIADRHCTVEEDMFFGFLDAARMDYDLQDFTQVDMYMLYRAAFSWINSIRAQIVQNLYSPTQDYGVRAQMAGVRESKEFRECMDKLGMTRKHRQSMRRKDFQIGITAQRAEADITLSNIMAQAARKSVLDGKVVPDED